MTTTFPEQAEINQELESSLEVDPFKKDPKPLIWAKAAQLQSGNLTPEQFVDFFAKREQQIRAEAIREPMTKLLTKQVFFELLQNEFGEIERLGEDNSAMIFFDGDGVKQRNDESEDHHTEGDKAIVSMAEAIKEGLRKEDFAARYGGDEFIALLRRVGAEQAIQAALRCRENLTTKQEVGKSPISFSIGITPYKNGYSVEDFIKQSDLSMYDAKATKRGSIVVFVPDTAKAEEIQKYIEENHLIDVFVRSTHLTRQQHQGIAY